MGIGSANPLLLASASAATDDSDPVTRSLRFDSGDSPSVYNSFSSDGSNGSTQKFTFSGWLKIANTSYVISWGNSSGYWDNLMFFNGKLRLTSSGSGSMGERIAETSAVFRDNTAWMHVCVVVDVTQSSNADCIKIFVNGVQQSLTFSGSSFVGTGLFYMNSAGEARFARGPYTTNYSSGILADLYFIDGSAVTPVGNFIQDTGYNSYKPKSYNMSSHSGNSFHLEFKETGVGTGSSTTVGADTSGQDNHFDSTNIVASDVMLDTPTKNYAVLNPLDPAGSDNTLSEGNLKCVVSAQNTSEESTATIGISSGKWYWEQYVVSSSNGGNLKVGVKSDTGSKYWHVRGSDGETESDTGSGASNGSSSVSYSTTNIVGVAVDMDAGKWWVSVDGTFVGSPTAGTGELHSGLSGTVLPYVLNASSSSGSHTIVCNFGQDPTFAGNKTSGQDTSQSEFYDAPPENFNALCSANFDDPAVKAHENFNTITYSGGDDTDTGVGFQPDMTWIKQRDVVVRRHHIQDSLRTAGRSLFPNDTTSEEVTSSYVTSFDSDGFSLGTSSEVNGSGKKYVAWNWLSATSANSGNETHNSSSGWSIIKWTGDSSSYGSDSVQSVNHSLGVAPEMIIAKNRTKDSIENYFYGNYDWVVYHKDLSSDNYVGLNSSSSEASHDGYLISSGSSSVSFGNDMYTSSLFMNADGSLGGYTADTYVAYLFASVDGVCKVGSYTGTGVSDGAFVYTGFRPAFVMGKRKGSGGWFLWDNKRGPENVINNTLYPNTTAVESGSGGIVDFTANGFKIRYGTGTDYNGSDTIIYLAMAESPLKYANAR